MDFRAIAGALALDPERLEVTPLAGGVSSDVFLLTQGAQRFVAKRSLAQLKVAEDWPCDPARIWREVEALRLLAPVCAVPRVVYEDRAQFLYVMTAAPAGAVPWKSRLLAGDASPLVARRVGEIHAAMLAQRGFDDLGFFEELRIDPYYTFTANRHPDLAWAFARGTRACRELRQGLVHGDWSPKNILVAGDARPLALDFECIHYGDPAYDAAFLLNHLLLKTFYRPASAAAYRDCAVAYWETLPLDFAAVMVHLPLLLLARMDGKSPVDYLMDREPVRARVRLLARRWIAAPPGNVRDLWVE